MDYFNFNDDGHAQCENVLLRQIAAEVGTPVYIYSLATLRRHCQIFQKAFHSYPTLLCYAVKANNNLRILKEIFSHGFGADLVSLGELEKSLLAGVKPEKIVFSGVGKRDEEINRALDTGILSFNVESFFEVERIGYLCQQRKKKAAISLRINPDVDAQTHPKIATGLSSTKFGLDKDSYERIGDIARQHQFLEVVGLSCHIGSQMTDLAPLKTAAKEMLKISQRWLELGHPLKFIDLGGGLGIRYGDEDPPSVTSYAESIINVIKQSGLNLVLEPGRVLVGNVGVLLTRILGIKKNISKNFFVVDAAMNDLLRPTLYDSFHEILPEANKDVPKITGDVVGPICESGDFLGKDRTLAASQGDLLFVRGTGAYSSSMASQYNSRLRAPEVLVDGERYQIIKPRETLDQLWSQELCGINTDES